MMKKMWLILFIITSVTLFADNEATKPAGNTDTKTGERTGQAVMPDIGKPVTLAEENNLLVTNAVIYLQTGKPGFSNTCVSIPPTAISAWRIPTAMVRLIVSMHCDRTIPCCTVAQFCQAEC